MPADTTFKIGVCGLGERLGHVVEFLLQADKRFEIVAYSDPERSPLGREFLNSKGVSVGKYYEDLDGLLDLEEIDLLMIGSPNSYHLQQIERGLAAGVRVFSEKPVVVSEEETMRLLRLLAEHGSDQLLVGLVLRYSPLFRGLLEVKDRGELGSISSIEASEHLSPDHGAFFMKGWRRYENLSGGYILEKCVHDLDLYRRMMGCRPIRVASFGGRRTFLPENKYLEIHGIYDDWPWGRKSNNPVFDSDADIVDFQTAIIEYENGANLCFHTNMHVPDKFRRFCVIGTLGMAEGDFERNYLRVHNAQSGELTLDTSYDLNGGRGHYGSEELMVGDIAAHLFEGQSLPVSAIDALEAGVTAMKIDEARKTGQVVSLSETWKQFDAAFESK